MASGDADKVSNPRPVNGGAGQDLSALRSALAGPLADLVGTNAVLNGAAVLVTVSCAAGVATPCHSAARTDAIAGCRFRFAAESRAPAQPGRLR
jgi:hypothetical protein